MKITLLLCMLLTAFGVFAQGNYIDSTGVVQARHKQFVTVVNASGSALTVGKAVCLDLTADDGISVNLCAAAGNKPLCVVTDTSCAAGARCKCQTRGYFANASFQYVSTTPAVAGGVVYAYTDGTVYVPASPTASQFPVGVAFDAKAATGTLKIYINL